ncbi:MAG: GNAT family N-acetyltransferase [Alphaproteobacteria bacterium]|jgi:RimJ/RimL family protein N-acetyltransferase|nr:GNAT family N-acetyltransferase [Alphaproteobacteria bacterium]
MTKETDVILIDIPMPILTPRLLIRNVLPEDGKSMHEMKLESWNDLVKWMPWAKQGIGTVEDSEKVIRSNYAKFILREDMMMTAFDRTTGQMVAMGGLHRFDWEFRRFEIGCYVRSSLHNQGIATELANGLTRFAFGALAARRVEIMAATSNAASRRVIEKLGFQLESLREADAFLPDGSITGHAEYVRYSTEGLPDLKVEWRET